MQQMPSLKRENMWPIWDENGDSRFIEAQNQIKVEAKYKGWKKLWKTHDCKMMISSKCYNKTNKKEIKHMNKFLSVHPELKNYPRSGEQKPAPAETQSNISAFQIAWTLAQSQTFIV